MMNDDRLLELVVRWQEGYGEGRIPSVDELCADCPELRRSLTLALPNVEGLTALLRRVRPEGGAFSSTADATNGSTAGGSLRFQVLRPHRKGGLGEVFIAYDGELEREVALKRMQTEHTGNTDSRRRFLREAKITGLLEHPGIVPVYSLAQTDDGPPSYAMRLIQGETLKEAIERFHKHENPKDESPKDKQGALAFRQLLNRFVTVCQTIAYAHSRGVIHRDLKPANVILGNFGETMVVDWGLAKPMRDAGQGARGEEAAKETSLQSVLAVDSVATEQGQIVGTPQYMSPEQAAGRGEEVGPASDIYSLGATLYALLTGRPSFPDPRETNVATVLEQVQQGQFRRPRQVQGRMPRALEAICLKAMALRPEERYTTAQALADDVEHWLADEPVTAYREPRRTRAARWLRRHRTLGTSLAVLAGTGLVALLISTGALARSKARAERAEATAVEAAETATTAQQRAEKVLKYFVTTFGRAHPKHDGRTVTVAEVLKRSAGELSTEDGLDGATRGVLLNAIGETYLGLGMAREAVDVLEQARALCLDQLGAEHPDTLFSMNGLAGAYKEAGRLEIALPLFEETLKLRKATLGPQHTDTLTSMNNLAWVYQSAGRLSDALPLFEETLKRVKAKLGPEHPNTLTSMNNLAEAYQSTGRLSDALLLYEETLKLQKAQLGPQHTDTLRTMSNLASAYQSTGRLSDALPLSEETLKLLKAKLGPEHPSTLNSMNNLAFAYQSTGRLSDAVLLFEETLKLRKAELGPQHPDTLNSMNNLAVAYNDTRRLSDALPLYEETLKLQRVKLGPEHPQTLNSMHNLAVAYQSTGRLSDALLLFEETLKLQKAQLGPQHPNTLITMANLASAYKDAGRLSDAVPLLEKAAELMAARLGPKHPMTLTSMNNLAVVYKVAGRVSDAIRLLEETLKLRTAKSGPDHPDTLGLMNNVAEAYKDAGRRSDALPLLRDVLDKYRKQRPEQPLMVARTLVELGKCLTDLDQAAEAEPFVRESVAVREKHLQAGDWRIAESRSLLGGCLTKQQQFAQAERLLLESYEVLTRSKNAPPPQLADTLNRLVQLYAAWGQGDKAAEWHKEWEARKTSR